MSDLDKMKDETEPPARIILTAAGNRKGWRGVEARRSIVGLGYRIRRLNLSKTFGMGSGAQSTCGAEGEYRLLVLGRSLPAEVRESAPRGSVLDSRTENLRHSGGGSRAG